MRILHTADLHLGRQFNGLALDEDHAAVLDQIIDVVGTQSVDVLVIAGDVFDRAAPSETAVRQFNRFLQRVTRETAAAVVMIAGNHDSGDRIGSMAVMPDFSRALIRGPVEADEQSLLVEDEHGLVAFSALPFSYEHAARACFGDTALETPEHVLAAQVAAARRNVPEGARWVITAHAFVAGGTSGETERPLAKVGGIETVSHEIFDGAAYVALGHLHRPQSVGLPHIRYSGSPLAFGFDEAGAQKSMVLVDLRIDRADTTLIPFTPVRGVRVLKGRHAELLLADSSTDIVKAVLTDEAPVIDAMKRLREVFPNVCALVYERDERQLKGGGTLTRPVAAAEPIDVVGGFLQLVRDEPMSDREREIVIARLQDLGQKEDAA